jgi:hypothetical protein
MIGYSSRESFSVSLATDIDSSHWSFFAIDSKLFLNSLAVSGRT